MENLSVPPQQCRPGPKMIMTQVGLLFMHLMHFVLRHIYPLIYFRKPPGIPPDNDRFFRLSATTLAKKIRQRELTSQQVVESYINRIKTVNPYINAVIEERFQQALADAKLCDATLEAGKVTAEVLEKEKPLYGVPISVKESCSVKGMSYTGGTLSRKGVKAAVDGPGVEMLKNAGAILLCVTNTPEMSSSLQTTNLLFGATVNPYDRRKTSGGSSGGEGALIGAGASILGLGSDLLGSIKVPCLFNGIFGHKPSPGIVSPKEHLPVPEDLEFQKFIGIGPLARYAEDLHLVMKVLGAKHEKLLRLDDPVDLTKLRVFYVENFSSPFCIRATSSDIREAIRNGTRHLKKIGASLTELPQEWVSDMFYITTCLFGTVDMPKLLKDYEHPELTFEPRCELVKAIFGRSQFSLPFTIMATLQEWERYASPAAVQHYNTVQKQLRQRFKDLLADDAIFICPTYPLPAPFPQLISFQCDYGTYGGFANMLHLPSTNVPMGLNSGGLPIGFQVMAAPYQDRLCLAVAKELERAFGGWIPPS